MYRYFSWDLYLLSVKLLLGDIFRAEVQTPSQVQSSVIFLANHCNGTIRNICVGSMIQTLANITEPQSEFIDIQLWRWLIKFNELNVLPITTDITGILAINFFEICIVNETGTCFQTCVFKRKWLKLIFLNGLYMSVPVHVFTTFHKSRIAF